MNNEQWIILDTETTGLSEPISVVEIAAQRMRGWERDGEPFQILLNHDVPIESQAEAVHGHSRSYLREHGEDPYPMSVVAEQIEAILEDGVASPEELNGLKQFLVSILPV
ncbi:MAG: exonuclease domain-containing protein [Verrucomicrobiae bacterium]